MENKGFFWHVHHDILLEYCYDYEERVDWIESEKPKRERKARLRLFRPVKNVPKWIGAARKRNKYRLWEDIYRGKYKKTIEARHKKECPNCPWDGKTIFPKEKAK